MRQVTEVIIQYLVIIIILICHCDIVCQHRIHLLCHLAAISKERSGSQLRHISVSLVAKEQNASPVCGNLYL